jgi:hypothetical protein
MKPENSNPRLAAANVPLCLTDEALARHLRRLDRFAVENVRKGAGGPFGAELLLVDLTTKETVSLSGPQANAVLAKGLASAHAEAETLSADVARKALAELEQRPGHDLRLLQVSTGESCPACRAKQIAFLHHLIARGWPAEARMEVAFGASYEETATVAGFNDKPYDDDLKAQAPAMVKVRRVQGHSLSIEARMMLDRVSDGSNGFAVIASGPKAAHPDDVTTLNYFPPALAPALRDEPLLTTEVLAIQAASAERRAHGEAQPWNLGAGGRAVLLTTADELGPLMLSEAQWAGISEIRLLEGHAGTPPESPLVSNSALLTLARMEYNASGSPLAVRWLATGSNGLVNEAQHIWRDEVTAHAPDKLYNGADTAGG